MGQDQGEPEEPGRAGPKHVFEEPSSARGSPKGLHPKFFANNAASAETVMADNTPVRTQMAAGPTPCNRSGSAILLSGPKYFSYGDGLLAQPEPSECSCDDAMPANPERDTLAAGDHECLRAADRSAGAEKVTLTVASWNLAGVNKKAIEAVFGHVAECDVVAVQEFPKQVPGWQTISGQRYQGIIYQNYMMYRSVGVMYRADRYQLLKKRSSTRGVWVQLRHVGTQVKIWIGSLHLPNNLATEENARLLGEFITAGPKTGERAVVLGDYNVQFKWRSEAGGAEPDVLTAKWASLRQRFSEAGFQQVPPLEPQFRTPTFHSRKGTVSSTQIDGIFVTGNDRRHVNIAEGSRHELGTDHDRVEMLLDIRASNAKRDGRVGAGGARVVCRDIPPQQTVNQQTLQQLAQKYTKPVSLGGKFKASAAVDTLKDIAKAGKDARSWKDYRAALRKEKEAWRGDRILRASTNWGVYKSLTKPRKQWGEQYMAAAVSEDPVQDIKDHFKEVFHNEKQSESMEHLEGLLQGIRCEGWVPFTDAETKDAIMKGKRGKAIGPDRVPTELLQSLCADATSLSAITSFFNGIAETGNIPKHWDKSIATLLPKVVPPSSPKDLRPIALASHTSKAFARLLLGRLEDVLRVKGPKQFAAKGRQPAEFVWSALNIVHLAKEWKQDAYILKLDIRKAFDTVNRYRLAQKVIQWAEGRCSFEVRCLVRLLMSRDMMIAMPWCDYNIDANVGVKQGATESPILFAKLLHPQRHPS